MSSCEDGKMAGFDADWMKNRIKLCKVTKRG
jgi:hypothetical protein